MAIRFVAILRRITAAGLAGAIAGTLVAGLGGRLVMRIAAVVSPAAAGLETDNGELIGAVTAGGTLALLLFGGLASGLVGAVIWTVVSPWLPKAGPRRLVAAAAAAVALTGLFVVRSGGRDFEILESDTLLVALLLGLIALVGVALAWLDARLDRILPEPARAPVRLGLGYGVVAAVGALVIPIAFASYASSELCRCSDPPTLIAWALVVAGLATVATWVGWIRTGSDDPARRVRVVGTSAVALALGLGGVRLITETARILAAA